MGVSDAHEVGVDGLQSSFPGLRVRAEILIHRIARRGVDEQELLSVDRQTPRHRKSRQKLDLALIELVTNESIALLPPGPPVQPAS